MHGQPPAGDDSADGDDDRCDHGCAEDAAHRSADPAGGDSAQNAADSADGDAPAPATDGGESPGARRTSSEPRSDGGVDSGVPGEVGSTAAASAGAEGTDEFDPVEVFPESDEMDLRPGADSCYKCSTCDTNCPVAEVDDEFPGPKFQGPEQWRLSRSDAPEVDPSIEKCSNCMRCDHACPTDVPLSQMHNTARGKYVDDQLSPYSRTYIRKKLLSNYGRLGRIGAMVPRLTNVALSNRALRWVGDKVLGITNEREFPEFADQTFRSWWEERGGAQVESRRRRVAYFHGDYANYNTPEVGKALVKVFEDFGYEVAVPRQRCSGTPMFANGMLDDARRAAEVNVSEFASLIEEGYDVVCSCTSCSMALRQEYPELFDIEGIDRVAANTYDAVEYLRINEDLSAALSKSDADVPDVAYHAPCHARNQGLADQALEVGASIDGVQVQDVGDSCSGISGTYGWKSKHYDTSMAIGEEMFEHMESADADTGMTECPTCAMQMEHGTGYEVNHTLQLIAVALDLEGEAW
ncbi:sn-glycerol-3-phosphate dehydrogenase subunit C [Salinarchaeum sp. Harcht-Bsk1]|uniref:anaerobic glycerol-3-phosphate dehydrogenase subunit C n=1 Tax=Salinarchaeum sp. Harcht-Bsk1 TaxID=1333523 RepID=UPI0003423E4C|nr:anaerobic glycerol-3-phosphate dehydrogenase subunit C [Salinarchaeum sp. Harcht-Bsk1]AGN02055.1 sn-glycerol-3-phosphate dehydrogenase subunit C [Salinarchaeum sp. Harcht-Bsk1]